MSDFLYNPGAPGPMMLKGGSFTGSDAHERAQNPALRFADHIVKFKLTLPTLSSHKLTPQYQALYEAYEQLQGQGRGNSFVLYALLQDFNESVEQAITNKRSKGGFVENHWGPRPSLVSASGIVGVHLSAFGLTPFQVEDPDGQSETVLYWDPTTNMTLSGTPSASAPSGQNSQWMSKQLQTLGNTLINQIGANSSGATGDLLQSVNFGASTGSSGSPNYQTIDQNQAARTGTNAAFRKFRMILDLFKMNGVIFDTIPNPDIYPSTLVASDVYYDTKLNKYVKPPSIVDQQRTLGDLSNLDALRRDENLAPGNVRAVLPIEMYVKDTVYTGFFESFNYQLSEEAPFSAHYDFTFKAKNTQRTAVFYPDGTAGKKPYSLIINQNMTPGSR